MKRKVRHTGLGGAVPVEHEVYVCGALTVDVARRQIDLAGEPVALPPKAFDLLLVFLREPGVVHTREALFDRLWPGQVLLDANLTTTLSQLKRALDEPLRAKFRTVPRVGYAFDGEVERWEDESQIASVHESPAAAVATAAVSAAVAESSSGRARFLAAGMLALLAVVAIALIWRGGAAASRPIVVIGQIATPNGDADAWIGSALRDALLRRLAAWPAVRVVDRAGSVGSALIEGARAQSPDGADFVLGAEYAVSDSGRRIAIRLILDDPRREGVEDTLARETRPEDLLASVDALLAELRDDIAPAAPQWSAVSVSIAPAAVERYSDGLRRLARHDYGAARRAFEEAVALSPEFALAELRLADVLRRLGYQALAASHYRRLAERGDALGEEAGGEARARAYALAHEWSEAVSAWRRVSERFADEPRHRIGLARALIETGNEGRREAMVMLEALAAQARLAEFEIERLHALADACEADGDLARADTLLEQALARATEAALPVLEADAALKRGWIKQQRNQREPAREHYARARELFAATGMSLGEAAAQLNGLLIDIDRPDQVAPAALEQAIRAFIARARELGASALRARAELILADRFLFVGDAANARAQAETAQALFTELGDRRSAAIAQLRLARAELGLGQVKSARAHFEALRDAFPVGTPNHWGVRDGLTDALFVLGELDAARQLATAAIERYPSAEFPDLNALSYCSLSNVERMNASSAAGAALDGCLAFAEVERRSPQLLAVEADYALEHGQTARARAALDRLLPLIERTTDPIARDRLDVIVAGVLLRYGAGDAARRHLARVDVSRLERASHALALSYYGYRGLIAALVDQDYETAREWSARLDAAVGDESVLERLDADLLLAATADPKRDHARRVALVQQVQARSTALGLAQVARRADALATEFANAPDRYASAGWFIRPVPELLGTPALKLGGER